MSPFFFKRLLRAPARPLAVLLVCAMLAGVASFLFVYRAKQLERLGEVVSSAEVVCVVTDINGTRSSSLRMGWGAVLAVTDAGRYELANFVRDPRITKEFEAVFDLLGKEVPLLAVTSPKGLDDLDPARGGETVLFTEDDFYSSEEYLCIVSQEAFDKLSGETTLEATVTDPLLKEYAKIGEGTGRASFKVAGYYKGAGDAVYMPFWAGKLIEEQISNTGSADSISFLAADNSRLDELRQAASAVFGTVDPYAVGNAEHRFALSVHDEDLNATVAAVEQNIRRANRLIPVAFALALAAGFLLGYISTRNEKHTYALQRSFGMTKKRLLVSVLAEQLALPLVGCATVGLAFGSLLPALAAFGLYALGCFAAVMAAVSVSPAELLRNND